MAGRVRSFTPLKVCRRQGMLQFADLWHFKTFLECAARQNPLLCQAVRVAQYPPCSGVPPTSEGPAPGPCALSPVQLLAPVPVVLEPAGQGWQAGLGAEALPPAEKVPTLQVVQDVPPVPGLHGAARVAAHVQECRMARRVYRKRAAIINARRIHTPSHLHAPVPALWSCTQRRPLSELVACPIQQDQLPRTGWERTGRHAD